MSEITRRRHLLKRYDAMRDDPSIFRGDLVDASKYIENGYRDLDGEELEKANATLKGMLDKAEEIMVESFRENSGEENE